MDDPLPLNLVKVHRFRYCIERQPEWLSGEDSLAYACTSRSLPCAALHDRRPSEDEPGNLVDLGGLGVSTRQPSVDLVYRLHKVKEAASSVK